MRKGFTLAELLVGMAILSVMTIALFEVYSSVSLANRRLDRARELTQAVRASTEEAARSVRENGLDFAWYRDEATREGLQVGRYLDLSGSGAAILAVKGGTRYWDAYETPTGTFAPCDAAHAGACFLAREGADGVRERLTSESITVTSLRFFVAGGEAGVPGKATIVGAVDLVKKLKENPDAPGVNFQTTVAERPYNHND